MTPSIILVPLDGSKQALAAVPVAKALCEIGGMAIRILHVGHREPSREELYDRLAHGTQALDDLPIDARTGDPAAEIVRAARDLQAELIVMCRHSRSGPAELLGRTATHVLVDAPCPVILAPPERGLAPWYLHHLLVPHDGTPTTSAALGPAMRIASLADAELLVAHVTQAQPPPGEPGSFTIPRYLDQPQYDWPSWGNEFAERLACMCPLGRLHVRVFLARGEPASEILRLSEEQPTDLVVLAWRGRWEAPHAHILKDVLRRAPLPVMIVRARATGREAGLEASSAAGGQQG